MTVIASSRSKPSPWKTVTVSSLGSALEYYDFVIYAVFAATISKEFFPSDSAVTSLFNTFLVFAGGYVMRPLGGIFFSHIGDRFGRRPAFLASMLLMTFAMIAMALVPGFAKWGVAATVLFTTLRLLQGFSIGGEVPSAVTYVVESIPQRGVTGCAIIMAAMAVGVLLANGCNALLISLLPPDSIAYAWRIAFVLGGLLGFINYLLRKNTLHGYAQSETLAGRIPLVELLKRFPGRVIAGMGIASVVAIYSSLFYVYIPSYLTRILDYDPKEVANSLTICFFIGPLATLLFGFMGDRISAVKLHRWGSIIIMIGAVPAFTALIGHTVNLTVLLLSFSVIGGLMVATHAWILADIFPRDVRCSGIAVAYNISYAIFGGFTPVIVTGLIQSSGSKAAPGFYLASIALAAVVAGFFVPKFSGYILRENSPGGADAAIANPVVSRGNADLDAAIAANS